MKNDLEWRDIKNAPANETNIIGYFKESDNAFPRVELMTFAEWKMEIPDYWIPVPRLPRHYCVNDKDVCHESDHGLVFDVYQKSSSGELFFNSVAVQYCPFCGEK